MIKTLTVKELIDQLLTCDPNKPALVGLQDGAFKAKGEFGPGKAGDTLAEAEERPDCVVVWRVI
jgi:hypothetical protein